MKLKQLKDYYNTKTVEFVIKENYELVEDREFIPRFSLKNVKEISDIPVNEPIKYSDKIMTTAIKYGMVMLINYKGEKDSHFSGHERVIYPLVLGRSTKGKTLLRGWHLNGWSVSNKRHVNKIWRLFRTDRILSITFTGSFYRLAPAGYKMNDKGMRGGLIAKADFIRIRKNQQDLINQNKIQNRDEITMGDEKRKFVTVDVTDTETELDLTKPLDNTYIKSIKDFRTTRISFLRDISGKRYIAILGALGQPGNTVKVVLNNKNLGVFKVMDSITGNVLKSIKRVKGNSVYDLYVFDKKR
tara:strand:+ start:102 stop:1001 length:900 start_codon:yes stop_codon:yes gene_type:complete